MGKLIAWLFGAIVGAAAMFFASNYHVVRADAEWCCVPRKHAGVSDVYADIRAWSAADWEHHRELVQSLVAHGRGDLVVEPAARGILHDLLEGLSGPKRVGQADDESSTR